MAFIDDIKIAGMSAQDSTPVTPGLLPIISWTYVNDPGDPGQVEFELRIGTSNTNIGRDAFVGDVLDLDLVSGSNFYEYVDHNLYRGIIYYGQLRSRDADNDATDWTMFSFQINRLPSALDAYLFPSTPMSNENIELVYTYYDADNHEQADTKIRWIRNGLHAPQYDDVCTLPASATEPGDSWFAKIMPCDGLEYGFPEETEAVTIQAIGSTDPITGYNLVHDVKILPINPNVDDILKVEYEVEETPYIPLEEYTTLEWYVNDQLIPDSNSEYIRLRLNPGDSVFAKVRITSATGYDVTSAQSEPKIISDVDWYIYNLEVSGQRESINMPDVTPLLSWQTHKTTAQRVDKPFYLRVVVNKVDSLEQTIYDSGHVEYKTNSYQIPSGVLNRGESYFVHVGAGDVSPISESQFITTQLRLAGSSWESNASNSTGWSIEFSMTLPDIAGGDAFANPFLPAGSDTCSESDPSTSACNRFATSRADFFDAIKIVADHPDVLGQEDSSKSNVSTTQTINALNSGFVIRRIYPFPCTYDGDFLSGAQQPFNTSTDATDDDKNAAAAWQTCYDAYHQMSIPTRREALSDGNEIRLLVHDGTRFCSLSMQYRTITFTSTESVSYTVPSTSPDLSGSHIYRIDGQGNNAYVYLDNKLVLSVLGGFDSSSLLRRLELGDFNPRKSNTAIVEYFKYSTDGIKGTDNVLTEDDTFYFKKVSALKNGSIDFLTPSRVVWTPEADGESSKVYEWNPSSMPIRLSAANRNFSPVTAIYIDEKRNKYIGTTNGLAAIYGDKHTADYTYSSDGTQISPQDFDRITTVPVDSLPFVEQPRASGWISIDTTYRTIGQEVTSLDPYDPTNPYYTRIASNAIHYYSQRVPGHSWFDNADNTKGWRISFSFMLGALEADDYEDEDLDHEGFGFYVNDGTRQEVVYFYEDRIRLLYANVYKPISTTVQRDYVITAKGDNIFIYQRASSGGSYSLLLDGTGLFTTTATVTANNKHPKIVMGSDGAYHAVWHADGNKRSRVFYSRFDGTSWSYPEVVTQSDKFDLRNANVDIDSQGRVWVCYEDTSWGQTEISVSVKDSIGWNPKTRITNSPSPKGKPSLKVDISDNIHLVWEDQRNGNWAIYYAWWESSKQAWHSSGQFGYDSVAMQHNPADPYLDADVMEFRNPSIALLHPYIWLVCECQQPDINLSTIMSGYKDVAEDYWVGSGVIQIDVDGNVVGVESGTVISEVGKLSFSPTIAANPVNNTLCVAWEDQTEPIHHVYGQVFDSTGNPQTVHILLSGGIGESKSPAVGAVGSNFIVGFVTESGIAVNRFDGSTFTFGAATTLLTTDKTLDNICFVPVEPSDEFYILYDYLQPRDAQVIHSVEYPDFNLIGAIQHQDDSGVLSFLSDTIVTPLSTKEFAFGDMSENVGMIAHWRNIEMYFGYDARPYSIAYLDTNSAWPEASNRINDVFADVYGNLIVSTYKGLVYYNVFAAKPVYIEHFKDLTVNMAKWAKSGRWYVAYENGIAKSVDAGKTWEDISLTNSGEYLWLSINESGYIASIKPDAVIILKADDDSVKIEVPFSTITNTLRCVAIDDNNIVWIGAEDGLYRMEGFSADRITRYSSMNGMRSSYVNDIAIVNNQLRYLATVTGVEKMYGSRFESFNTHNAGLLSDNTYRLRWDSSTNSLWISSMYDLHEIVFRDASHEVIADEIVTYSSLELSNSALSETDKYYVVDTDLVPQQSLNYRDSSKVFINRNEIDFGYTVSNNGLEISFACNLLLSDEIDVELSTMFNLINDFNQLDVQRQIEGEKTTLVKSIRSTSTGHDFYLASTNDKSGVLLDAGWVQVPFATLMLDLEKPFVCLRKNEVLSRSLISFTVVAYDQYSGLDSYQISNNPEFTDDDGNPLDWEPMTSAPIIHDIGEDIDNVVTSFDLPDEFDSGTDTYGIGDGSFIGVWQDISGEQHLIAITSNPVAVFRYYPEGDPSADDPADRDWRFLQVLDNGSTDRYVTSALNASDGSLYITTATAVGGFGNLQRMTDGLSFTTVGMVDDPIARGIAETTTSVLYGAGNGSIYEYVINRQTVQSLVKYSDIGQSIYALDCYQDKLLVASYRAGDDYQSALVYSIDLVSGDNLVEFIRSDSIFTDFFIHNKQGDPANVLPFVGTNTSEIYAATIDQLSFQRSYASTGSTVSRIHNVSKKVFDNSNTSGDYAVVAAIGNNLMMFNGTSWDFVYRLDEEIKDFVEVRDQNFLWIISATKVIRWAQITEDTLKTVYVRVMDKAGNISEVPSSALCPPKDIDNPDDQCCSAYSLRIADLKKFVNESRIIDVTSTGQIIYAYQSPTGNPLYAGDKIDYEQGVYTSEIFNGSSNLVSWKSIAWSGTKPNGTTIAMQIRYGKSESLVRSESWSQNLVPDTTGSTSLEYVTDQYLQFRVILTSTVRDVSPTLTAVTLRNITTQASHFFTTNFVLPSRPVKGILTANTYIPVSSDIIFGINTKNTTDFADYQLIEPNRLFTVSEGQFMPNLRIGARLLSPSIKYIPDEDIDPYDPYIPQTHYCSIAFDQTNETASDLQYHFRIRFFNDSTRTQLVYTFFSGNDQSGWSTLGIDDYFPAEGITITSGGYQTITFTPLSLVDDNQRWYLIIDSYDGTSFTTLSDNSVYVCANCYVQNEPQLIAEFYQTGMGELSKIPVFGKFNPDHTLLERRIDFPTRNGVAWVTLDDQLVEGYVEDFAIKFRGELLAAVAGTYTFYLSSDDGSRLFIDNSELIDNDGVHELTEKSNAVYLSAGLHHIEVHYFQRTGNYGLQLKWTTPGGITPTIVPDDVLFHSVASEYCVESESPRIYNFAVMFELENGEVVKLNLT